MLQQTLPEKQEKNIDSPLPPITSVIEGKLLYLKMVKGEGDRVYQNLMDNFNRLMKSIKTRKIKKENGKESIILWSLTLEEFRQKMNVDIKVKPRKNGTAFNLIIEESKDGEEPTESIISVSQKTIQVFINEPQKVKISKCVSVDSRNKYYYYYWMTTFRPNGNLEARKAQESDKLSQRLEEFYNNGDFDLSKL